MKECKISIWPYAVSYDVDTEYAKKPSIISIDLENKDDLFNIFSRHVHSAFLFNGSRNEANFVETYFLFFDFDSKDLNVTTVDDFESSIFGQFDHIVYCSRNNMLEKHKPGKPVQPAVQRFHVMYPLSSVQTEHKKVKTMISDIQNIMISKGLHPDTSTKDLARLTYPSRLSGDLEPNIHLYESISYKKTGKYLNDSYDDLMVDYNKTTQLTTGLPSKSNVINIMNNETKPVEVKKEKEISKEKGVHYDEAERFVKKLPADLYKDAEHKERFVLCSALFANLPEEEAEALYIHLVGPVNMNDTKDGNYRNIKGCKKGTKSTPGSMYAIAVKNGFKPKEYTQEELKEAYKKHGEKKDKEVSQRIVDLILTTGKDIDRLDIGTLSNILIVECNGRISQAVRCCKKIESLLEDNLDSSYTDNITSIKDKISKAEQTSNTKYEEAIKKYNDELTEHQNLLTIAVEKYQKITEDMMLDGGESTRNELLDSLKEQKKAKSALELFKANNSEPVKELIYSTEILQLTEALNNMEGIVAKEREKISAIAGKLKRRINKYMENKLIEQMTYYVIDDDVYTYVTEKADWEYAREKKVNENEKKHELFIHSNSLVKAIINDNNVLSFKPIPYLNKHSEDVVHILSRTFHSVPVPKVYYVNRMVDTNNGKLRDYVIEYDSDGNVTNLDKIIDSNKKSQILSNKCDGTDPYYNDGTMTVLPSIPVPNSDIIIRDTNSKLFEYFMNKYYGVVYDTTTLLKFMVQTAIERRTVGKPALLVQGVRGSGKSLILQIFKNFFGAHNAKEIIVDDKFNGFRVAPIIYAEETAQNRYAYYNEIKEVTGAQSLDVRMMHTDQQTFKCDAVPIVTSNNTILKITDKVEVASQNQWIYVKFPDEKYDDKFNELNQYHPQSMSHDAYLSVLFVDWLYTDGFKLYYKMLKDREKIQYRYGFSIPVTPNLISLMEEATDGELASVMRTYTQKLKVDLEKLGRNQKNDISQMTKMFLKGYIHLPSLIDMDDSKKISSHLKDNLLKSKIIATDIAKNTTIDGKTKHVHQLDTESIKKSVLFTELFGDYDINFTEGTVKLKNNNNFGL